MGVPSLNDLAVDGTLNTTNNQQNTIYTEWALIDRLGEFINITTVFQRIVLKRLLDSDDKLINCGFCYYRVISLYIHDGMCGDPKKPTS